MPAQQGSRGDEPNPAQRGGEQSAQRAEDGAIEPGHYRAWVVSTQHGDLVAEHHDLDVLGCIGSSEQGQPAQHADEHQVDESQGHKERSWGRGCGPWPHGRPVAKGLIRPLDTILGTHTIAIVREWHFRSGDGNDAQHPEQRAIERGQLQARVVSAQHGDLVTENEDPTSLVTSARSSASQLSTRASITHVPNLLANSAAVDDELSELMRSAWCPEPLPRAVGRKCGASSPLISYRRIRCARPAPARGRSRPQRRMIAL